MVTTWLLDETPGHTPLWQVFWIYGVLVSHLLFGSILYLFRAVDTPTLALMLSGFVLYTAWIMRVVWRNAFNVGNPLYGHIARALTVAWALNTVLVSGFLLLAESHVSIHTWPAEGRAAVDVYTCGEARPDRAHEVFLARLGPSAAEVVTLRRGERIERLP